MAPAKRTSRATTLNRAAELSLRSLALGMAKGENAEAIVLDAEKFLAFLKGEK